MACLYLANRVGSFIGRTVAPTMSKNIFVPAVTKEQKVIGGIGKFAWETYWLSYDVEIATFASIAVLTPLFCKISELMASSVDMSYIAVLSSIGAGVGTYIGGKILIVLFSLYRIMRSLQADQLKVINLDFNNKIDKSKE